MCKSTLSVILFLLFTPYLNIHLAKLWPKFCYLLKAREDKFEAEDSVTNTAKAVHGYEEKGEGFLDIDDN